MLANINTLFKRRNNAIKFLDDYSLMILEAKRSSRRKSTLVQVETCNTSQNILNEISQIICSLYREKELTKKVCSSIMDSIKL